MYDSSAAGGILPASFVVANAAHLSTGRRHSVNQGSPPWLRGWESRPITFSAGGAGCTEIVLARARRRLAGVKATGFVFQWRTIPVFLSDAAILPGTRAMRTNSRAAIQPAREPSCHKDGEQSILDCKSSSGVRALVVRSTFAGVGSPEPGNWPGRMRTASGHWSETLQARKAQR